MERQIDAERLAQAGGYEAEAYSHAAAAPGWTRAEPRVVAYLRASGIVDDNDRALMLGRIRARISSRKSLRYDDEPVTLAIRETIALIDDWLAVELGLDRHQDRGRILEARAALLKGDTGDWFKALIASRDGEVSEALNRAVVPPVPPDMPIGMPTQSIGLRYISLRRVMLRMLVRLAGLFGLRR